MTHLLWFTKVWNTLRILGAAFILIDLGIGIAATQELFSPPNWVWIDLNIIVCFFAFCLCLRFLEAFTRSQITPAYSGACRLAAAFGAFSFGCSFIPDTFFHVVSFTFLCIGFFTFLFAESSFKHEDQITTKQKQQKAPLSQEREPTVEHPQHAHTNSYSTARGYKSGFSIPHASPTQKVIVIYDAEDEKLAKQLRDHLRPLKERGAIDLWDQTKILPGAITHDEMEYAIESAGVAVVLTSTNFLNSDYIQKHQLPTLLSFAANRGTWVIPVRARACFYRGTGLEKFHPVIIQGKLPKTLEAMPVPDRNEYLSHLAEAILQRLGIVM